MKNISSQSNSDFNQEVAIDQFTIPHQIEKETKENLRKYLESIKQWDIERNLEELLTIGGGFVDRLNFFEPYLDSSLKESLLVSGCSVGSELVLALNHGFKSVTGTEVVKEYVEIGKKRLNGIPNTSILHYDGFHLPFSDTQFSCIASGHIIEHTPSPYKYFVEHMRVLKPGGIFFIEFPDRYYSTELHTGVRSYEWMPSILRDIILRYKSSSFSRTTSLEKERYQAIRTTLSPISIWQIKLFLLGSRQISSRIIAVQYPAPGFTRILVQKR